MMMTEDDLIIALDERGIPANKRVLTDWRRKHYLPPLQSLGRGQGKGKTYFWADSNLIERAVLVDELLLDGFKGTRVNLTLWLFGHEAPLSIIRERLLAGIEKFEHWMTGGNCSPGEIEDHISQSVYDYERDIRLVNRKHPEIELPPQADLAEMEQFMNLLANPGISLDDLQLIGAAASPPQTAYRHSKDLMTEIAATDERVQSGWEWFRQHFSLADLKASLLLAGDQELWKVGEDIRRIIATAGEFFSKIPEVESLRPQKTLLYIS